MFCLTSFTNVIRYANLTQWPIAITLSVPAHAALTKYAMRAKVSSQSIRFLDVRGIEVGRDTGTSETFASDQSTKFDIAATSVRKAVLTIKNIPSIVRSTVGYFVNSAGRLELAAANALRFQYNPVTLAPSGILVEEHRTNVLSNTDNTMDGNWVRVGASLNTSNDFPLYAARGNVYYFKGDGSWNAHHVYRMFNNQMSLTRTISVYFMQHTVIWAQIAPSTAFIVFVNFNLSNGVLGTLGSGASSSTIVSAPNGWYQCELTFSTFDA
jgi:hypothetical protein